MNKQDRYPQELRERAVRMVEEHRREFTSEWQATCQSPTSSEFIRSRFTSGQAGRD